VAPESKLQAYQISRIRRLPSKRIGARSLAALIDLDCLGITDFAAHPIQRHEDIVARCCDAWNFFTNDIATVRLITTREYARAVKGLGSWHKRSRTLTKLG